MIISFSFLPKKQFVLALLVFLLLNGCGHTQNLSRSTRILSTATSALPPLGSLATNVDFDLGGWIHIQSTSGFACANPNPSSPPGLLVLPKVQPTYDQGTLQPMENYVSILLNNIGDYRLSAGRRDTVPYPAFSANPDDFQLLPVGDVDRGACTEILHITNIRKSSIQISQVSLRLTADTQKNHQHYNLLEGCSLVSLMPECEGGIGGGEGEYTIAFNLHPGKANTKIECSYCLNPALTLKSGEITRVLLSYSTSLPSPLSFSLMPSFTLGLLGGKQTSYPAPQLQETFAFASRFQFSCYSLQGQRFIRLSASQMQSGAWCI